jgi:HK97 gp10 family phage protein
MSKINYTVELNLKDKEVTEEMKKRIEQKMAEVCVLIQDDAKRECPVDTGRLQGSITYEVNGTEGAVGTNVEYAPYVHDGTSKMSARPFLRNAGEKNKDKITKMFEGLV